MKKLAFWTVGAGVVLFAGTVIAVHTHAFRNFLLREIVAKAQTSTGARIDVRSLALHWTPLTVDLYGVGVHGREAPTEPPLATVEHLRVSLGIDALLHRKVDLFTVIVDRPVVNVYMGADGSTNLPQPATKSTTHFQVVVRHFALTNGLLHYNDQATPLAAELQDFRAEVNYDHADAMYHGTLSYQRGWIVAKDFRPVENNAQAEFSASAQGIIVQRLAIATEKSRFALRATLVDFSSPKLEGNYEGVLDTVEIAHILKNTSLPVGDVALQGSLTYQNDANRPFLDAVRIQGNLQSKALAVHETQASLTLTGVSGTYRLEEGGLHVAKLDADLLGGHLVATADMLHLDANPASRVTAALRGISLERIRGAVPRDARANVVLKGRLRADLRAAWSGSIADANAHAHVEIYGPLSPATQGNEIPVNGNVTVDYDGARQTASFDHSEIRTLKTSVALTGILSRSSKLNVQANASDLHELAALASTVMAASHGPSEPPPTPYDIFGSAQFNGQLSGAIQNPRLRGQLTAANLVVQGSKWRTVRASIDAASSNVHLQNVYAQTDQGGDITLNAQTALQHWSFTPDSQFSAQGKLNKLAVGELQLLAKTDYPIRGMLSGEFNITGSEHQPKGEGSLQLANAEAWSEPINAFIVQFHGTNTAVNSTLKLRVPAGAANANVTYFPKSQTYQANVDAPDIRLDQIPVLQQRKAPVTGTLTLQASGSGAIGNPQLTAKLTARELQVSGQKFSDLDANLELANQHAQLQITSGVAQASVQVNAGVDLRDDYQANATLDVHDLPLQPLLASYNSSAAQDLHGQTEIHGTLRGPLKDLSHVDAQVTIPALNVQYQNLQLGNKGPLRLSYRNGVATIDQFQISGTGTELSARGVIPVKSSAPMNVAANGTVDMSLLQMIAPDIHSSGRIDINVKSRGPVSDLSTQGEIHIVNAALSSDALPVALSAFNGDLAIAGNRVDIKEIKGSAGGGTIAAYGNAVYGKQPNFAVSVQAKSVRIHPSGLRAILDGNVQLNGTPQKSTLSGQVLIDRLSFQDGFDLGTFLAQVSSSQQVSAPSAFESNMKLAVSVQSTPNLRLASNQLSMEGSANLNVTGTAANPVILGRVSLTGGEIFLYGKRFDVQNGTIAFANPAQTEPVLNLYMKTVVRQYNITIHLMGPATELKTSYTSDPALSQLDIINLLAFGETTAEKASSSEPASVGAESALASQAAGRVAGKIQQATGISQLTIDPLAATNTVDPAAQVSVQERLTGSVLLTFSTDVTSSQQQSVELQYKPKGHWEYSFIRGVYGSYSFDLRYHKSF